MTASTSAVSSTSQMSPRYLRFCTTICRLRSYITLPSHLVTCQNDSQNSGSQHTYDHSFLMKDTTHTQVNSRHLGQDVKGLSWPIRMLLEPHCARLLMEASLCRHHWLIHWPLVTELSLQFIFPLLRSGCGAKISGLYHLCGFSSYHPSS